MRIASIAFVALCALASCVPVIAQEDAPIAESAEAIQCADPLNPTAPCTIAQCVGKCFPPLVKDGGIIPGHCDLGGTCEPRCSVDADCPGYVAGACRGVRCDPALKGSFNGVIGCYAFSIRDGQSCQRDVGPGICEEGRCESVACSTTDRCATVGDPCCNGSCVGTCRLPAEGGSIKCLAVCD